MKNWKICRIEVWILLEMKNWQIEILICKVKNCSILSSSRYEELTDCCEYVFLLEEYVLLLEEYIFLERSFEVLSSSRNEELKDCC